MMRLAIISTHPIQYNAPFFMELSLQSQLTVKVFYTWSQARGKKYDPGFDLKLEWDIPLLEGYEFEFVKNIAVKPGSDHFWGIINPSLIVKLKTWKPDFILVYGWAFLSHLSVIKYFYKKIPILFRGDSTILDQPGSIKIFLKKVLLNWVYSSVDECLYVGINNYKYYRNYKIPENRLKYLPHAVDNEKFRKEELIDFSGDILKLKRIFQGKLTYIFVGKFESKKNPLLLVEAFSHLADPCTALLFVGQGKLEKEMKERAIGIPGIYFLPFQNQKSIRCIYHIADVLVLPSSYNETWGLVVNEAMAAGLAIIVSDKVGCAPDLVENGINGYVFDSGDVKSLIAKMKAITAENLDIMKTSSLHKIEQFSIKKNALTLVNMLLKNE